jgi:hypothetical protein
MDDHPWPCVVHRSVRETVERVRRCRAMLGGRSRGWQSSPSHLGRHRDPGQPGETIAIPIKTGEQSSLALPTGEGHAPIMAMQLPHACSAPMSSHCETGLVSRPSSGCSLPASRSPRAPVREGQRQRLPAPTSALSSPTAQRGMVSLLPTSPRESRFSMAYSHPYESNPMTWRAP